MKTFITILLFILMLALIFGVSWLTTCGLVYLITLCFGWEFSWLIATGVWLIMMLVGNAFRARVSVEK